jgi:hypothetical protein
MSKQPLLDMFNRVLPAIDTRNRQFYSNLSEEEKKGFSPWLVQRYLSSAESANKKDIEHYLIATNTLVNTNEIKDPELTWKLMSIVGIGKSVKHPYIAPSKGRKRKDNIIKDWLQERNPSLNQQEVDILFESLDKKTFLDMLSQYNAKDKQLIAAANDL